MRRGWTRLVWLVLAAFLLPLPAPAPLLAQEDAPGNAGPELAGSDVEIAASLLSRVEARWWRRKGLEDSGSTAQAGEAGRGLVRFLPDGGVSRGQPLAARSRTHTNMAP